MQRYSVSIPSANSGRTAKEAVEAAFEDRSVLEVEGVKEGVEINFGLYIDYIERLRRDAGIVLYFGGVVQPTDAKPKPDAYLGKFQEDKEDSPIIVLEVKSQQ